MVALGDARRRHKPNIAEATQRPRIFQAASDAPVEFEPGFPVDMLKLMEERAGSSVARLTVATRASRRPPSIGGREA